MVNINTEKLKAELFELHNNLRQDYGAPPLRYSKELEEGAQKKANDLANGGKMEHDKEIVGISENILRMEGIIPTANLIFISWADQRNFYDFGKNEFQPKSGNFSQIVWVNSEELGIGIQVSHEGSHYVVARYRPGGNYEGMFSENVLKRGSEISTRSGERIILPLLKIPDENSMKDYLIIAHNAARARHLSPPVEWDSALSKYAFEVAAEIIKAREMKLPDPFIDKGYGANIMFCEGGIPPLHEICSIWYSQSSKVNFDNNEYQKVAGSYTQMVWYDTKYIGAAMYSKNDNCCFVCLYSPPGNIKKGYKRNIEKLKYILGTEVENQL